MSRCIAYLLGRDVRNVSFWAWDRRPLKTSHQSCARPRLPPAEW